MAVNIRQRSLDPRTTLVEVEGELDLYAAAQLNASLAQALDEQCRQLVLDVRAVTELDFSAIAIIVQTARVLAQRRGTLEVVCREGGVAQLLEAAGEQGDFEIRVEREGGGAPA